MKISQMTMAKAQTSLFVVKMPWNMDSTDIHLSGILLADLSLIKSCSSSKLTVFSAVRMEGGESVAS